MQAPSLLDTLWSGVKGGVTCRPKRHGGRRPSVKPFLWDVPGFRLVPWHVRPCFGSFWPNPVPHSHATLTEGDMGIKVSAPTPSSRPASQALTGLRMASGFSLVRRCWLVAVATNPASPQGPPPMPLCPGNPPVLLHCCRHWPVGWACQWVLPCLASPPPYPIKNEGMPKGVTLLHGAHFVCAWARLACGA